MWDVLASCRRRGAADASIHDARPNDFRSFRSTHPVIVTVALNGSKATQLFDDLVPRSVFSGCDVIRLPSTSPANARVSLQQLIEAWTPVLL